MRLLLLMFLVGCGQKTDEQGGGVLSGTIETTGGLTGAFDGMSAFGFDDGATLVAVISSSPDATCEGVGQYVDSEAAPVEPGVVHLAGMCTMAVVVSDYTDGYEREDDRIASASTSIECAMGEGSFEWVDYGSNGQDYEWSGDWWLGFPTEYLWSFSGGQGDDFVLDIDMKAYDGNFSKDGIPQSAPATGSVKGSVTAEWCEDLSKHWRFQ